MLVGGKMALGTERSSAGRGWDRLRYMPRPLARAITRILQRSTQRPWIPVRLQRAWTALAARALRGPAGIVEKRGQLGGVPAVRIEGPSAKRDRAVLYLHGGAYILGSAKTHASFAAWISEAAGAPAHLLEYRLAPEHPYPAAVEDALAAYRGLLGSGIAPDRIAVVGDSAGAGLAIALALRLREAGEEMPGGIVFMGAWLDVTCSGSSMETNAKRDVGLRRPWVLAAGDAYRGGEDSAHPEISPVNADLRGLPPVHLQVGTDEILLSDSDSFVKRARAAGVQVSYRRFEGMWHDFQLTAGQLQEADDAVADIGAAIRGFWGEPAGIEGNGRPARPPTVAIIGAGFGGIGLGIRLKKLGIDSFTILEKGDRIGGVWRDNTYPGATCDVPSHLYSFSFEPNPDWTRRYSPQEEILGYLERCVARYGLQPHLRFGTEVAHADFDEERGKWRVATSAGEEIEVDVLVSACGQLSRPALTRIAGSDRFEGAIFHSARWDHDVDLSGKRVAVVGTGASTIQIVPAIAGEAERLDVYQRSPHYVLPKKDRPYREWERLVCRWFPPLRWLQRFQQWLVFEVFVSAFNQFKPLGKLGIRMFERNLEEQVSDPELRRALTPDDVIGCKRVLISGDYYSTLERPDVELVTQGVQELTPRGVVAEGGSERPADVVVLSTGFETQEFLAPMELRGLGGLDLNEAWRQGANAYLGMTVAGFPNLFIMYGPNTNLGSGSIIYQLESQMNYIVDAIRALSHNGGWLSVRPEVQQEFDREMQDRLSTSVWQTGCNNWYVDENGRNTNNWPGFTLEYRRRTRRLELADYEVNGTVASISTSAPLGSEATPTVVRTGNGSEK
jgi:cation diffusion facilitator CzcD-associated flavoprotein CzcO/acetyl esterase/lipase